MNHFRPSIKHFTLLLTVLLYFHNISKAQHLLKRGFDAHEYRNSLLINAQNIGQKALIAAKVPTPNAKMEYRSKVSELNNRWDFWIDRRGVGIISIRGTLNQQNSWLENFYAAMVPATGTICISNKINFKYKLAQDSNAYVHVGWLIGLASLADDITAKIRAYHQKGLNDFIIIGHSQGGAIALLLRSYLHYLPQALAPNIRIKTYASAAPKVGNINYAYDFDYITRGGWAYRIINPLDWVPQIPFTIEKISNISLANPFTNINSSTQKMPWIKRTYIRHIYHKMDRKTEKAQKYYTKILGTEAAGIVTNFIPKYHSPKYASSFNYAPCGISIILRPTANYYKNFIPQRQATDGIFINHRVFAYLYLLKQNYPEKE